MSIEADFKRDGFAIIPALLAGDEVDRIIAELKPLITKNFQVARRIQDAWLRADGVRALAAHPKVLQTLKTIYGREAIPFQTLNFSKGSEQTTHSDAFHFNSIPQGFMCGVWVAFEDIDDQNGPLHYYPGSHKSAERFPSDEIFDETFRGIRPIEILIQESIAKNNFQKLRAYLKKGDAFIWSSNLFHGGEAIGDASRSRWSQVTHYYFENCLYYTPALSFRPLGQFFLRRIIDVRTGRGMPSNLNGMKVRFRQNCNGSWSLNIPDLTRKPTLLEGLKYWLRARANFLSCSLRQLLLKIRGPIVYYD